MEFKKSNQNQFVKEFSPYIHTMDGEKFSVSPDYIMHAPNQKPLLFDILIKTEEKKICIIEFLQGDDKTLEQSLNLNNFKILDVRFIVTTNLNSFVVRDRFEKKNQNIKGIQNFFTVISKPISKDKLVDIKNRVAEIVRVKVRKYFRGNTELYNHIDGLIENIKVSKRWDLFFEGSKTADQNFENKFFVLLMNNGEQLSSIFRYTSFKSIFESIEKKSIRMNGLPGMNDTTEVNYVDNFLKGTDFKLHEEASQTIAAVNRRFILCCSELNDELLQWRLYGDDSKGVCIQYKIDHDKLINRNSQGKRDFFLGKVKYANKNKKHRELELIKEIIETVRKKMHLEIRFTMLYVWKHFFKPYEYAYEKEVRLLYIERDKTKKKWVLTNSHNIINPFVEFSLNGSDFPLKMERVILGSKLSEKELNQAQFKQFLSEKGLKIEITHSTISNYR